MPSTFPRAAPAMPHGGLHAYEERKCRREVAVEATGRQRRGEGWRRKSEIVKAQQRTANKICTCVKVRVGANIGTRGPQLCGQAY